MPRVHSQVANKDYPDIGVKKGDTYYKWTTRPGGRGKGILHRSKTYPKPQQLTSSDFMIQMYDLQDRLNDLVADDSLEVERDSIAEDIRALGEEQQEKLDNMPEGLQQGSSGETLQSRIEGCDQWAEEIEAVEIPQPPEVERPEGEEPEGSEEGDSDDESPWKQWEEYDDALASALEEIQNCTYQGE